MKIPPHPSCKYPWAMGEMKKPGDVVTIRGSRLDANRAANAARAWARRKYPDGSIKIVTRRFEGGVKIYLTKGD